MSLSNVHLTPQLIQAVRDVVSIVDIAGDHTKLRKAGRQYEGLCPMHKEKTPSFSIDPDKGVYYCFGCGSGGDAIGLHMQVTGDDFPTAIETLARRYGIPLPKAPARRPGGAPEAPDLTTALEAACDFYREQLQRQELPRRYLAERRVPAELVEQFALGYAPDGWRNLLQALTPQIPAKQLLAAGLVATSERSRDPYDRFRHRLIFPIRAASGRLVGFGGRTLGDDKAKYINTAETDQFHKSRLLYGLHEARKELRESQCAVLVEGYFDVISCAAVGLPAVASMGTSLTEEQTRLLSRYVDVVVVGYDGDRAGETAHQRALPLLLGAGFEVRRAQFGDGHDPDSLRLEAGEAAVVDAIEQARDSVDLEVRRLASGQVRHDPNQQARAANEVVDLLRSIPDSIKRSGYGRRAAHELDIPEALLTRRLGTTGGRDEGPPPPSARSSAGPPRRETRSLEAQILSRLLNGDAVPDLERLPPAEAFFELASRDLYRAFLQSYATTGKPPTAQQLPAQLPPGGTEMQHLSRILVEGRETDASGGLTRTLGELLETLRSRWGRQRQRELAREIENADQRGDREALQRLIDEKRQLTRKLHSHG